MDEDEVNLPPLYKLTTIDNPFHPVDERDEWERYDLDHGYGTDAYLARVSGFSDYATEAENRRAENAAIDDVIRLEKEVFGEEDRKYKKILIKE